MDNKKENEHPIEEYKLQGKVDPRLFKTIEFFSNPPNKKTMSPTRSRRIINIDGNPSMGTGNSSFSPPPSEPPSTPKGMKARPNSPNLMHNDIKKEEKPSKRLSVHQQDLISSTRLNNVQKEAISATLNKKPTRSDSLRNVKQETPAPSSPARSRFKGMSFTSRPKGGKVHDSAEDNQNNNTLTVGARARTYTTPNPPRPLTPIMPSSMGALQKKEEEVVKQEKALEEKKLQQESELQEKEKALEAKRIEQEAKLKIKELALKNKFKELIVVTKQNQEAAQILKKEKSEVAQSKNDLYIQAFLKAYCLDNSTAAIDTCLAANYDIDTIIKDGKTLLHLAMEERNTPVAKYLLTNDKQKPTRNIQDKWGFTPLHYAAINHDLPMVQLLLWKEELISYRDDYDEIRQRIDRTYLSNALIKDKNGQTPRALLDSKNEDFGALENELLLGESRAKEIYAKVVQTKEEELKRLMDRKDSFMPAGFGNPKTLLEKQQEMGLFINTQLDGMRERIEATIILEEEKDIVLRELDEFQQSVQQDISILREIPKKNNPEISSSPSTSPTPKRPPLKFSLSAGNIQNIKHKAEDVARNISPGKKS
ncbi:MAG: ankyrin repeat domain-containing protein [Gammaproteobacteria bacterium]|nr:ankyrin repeat domain-containing protein [Gammaproteobacteria bacterium]